MQLYDWDVMGKEKIGTGQSQPIEELPAGEPQELWIPIELETAHVNLPPGHSLHNPLETVSACSWLWVPHADLLECHTLQSDPVCKLQVVLKSRQGHGILKFLAQLLCTASALHAGRFCILSSLVLGTCCQLVSRHLLLP